ncbi:PAS domain-containing sensor histidine kinase [Melittangium boletus]|uniref:histidine kinase n=1 Tax=Melittangium boletus DSM 14713 TaxID=1294270 RepID=A0A250IDE7_9BACT|nr:PAS domain-containing sensor histidine kinase [Melittangium boletus]ATB29220.1 sensory box histidine kinase [Melittangium boletus DSM 14713]
MSQPPSIPPGDRQSPERTDGGEVDFQAAWERERTARLRAEEALALERAASAHRPAEDQEERERFFRLAPDMFCVAGMDGYFRRINAAFSRTLGWSEEELLDRPFFDLVHPEDREATHAEVAKLSRGVPTLRFENRYRCKDGGYKWLAWATSPIPALGLLYAAARDITEHKRMEEQARIRADFEQKLIGIVSHDLRNPLGVILLGTTHLLRRQDLDPKVLEIITRIAASTQRCTRLVRDLLDFTQARLGMGIPLTPRASDLEALVRQGVEEVGASAPGREFRLSAEGDLRGTWDPDRLAQVVANLLSNAAKYSPGDTPIGITLRGEEAQVTLEVHNQGDPIPERLRARLFEPMQRGAPGADTTSRSVGLGLYIVKHLVEAHGGSVSARSVGGEGTRFTVRLPRAPPPASSLEPTR